MPPYGCRPCRPELPDAPDERPAEATANTAAPLASSAPTETVCERPGGHPKWGGPPNTCRTCMGVVAGRSALQKRGDRAGGRGLTGRSALALAVPRTAR